MGFQVPAWVLGAGTLSYVLMYVPLPRRLSEERKRELDRDALGLALLTWLLVGLAWAWVRWVHG